MDECAPSNPMMQRLAAGGILAPAIDVLVVIGLGALDPQYSHVHQYVSELGEQGRPFAWVFAVWNVLWGLLIAGFAIALRGALRGRTGSIPGPALWGLVAATSLLGAVFPCDPGCAGQTVTAQVHVILGWIGTSAMILAPFLTWLGMRGKATWAGMGKLTLLTEILLIVLAGWLAVGHYAGVRNISLPGAAQRLFLATLYVWVEVAAFRLWRMGSSRQFSRMSA
jgi:hypothetical membrane protein